MRFDSTVKVIAIIALCALMSVSFAAKPLHWFLGVTWDDRCSLSVAALTKNAFVVDSGNIKTSRYQHGNLQNVMFALPVSKGNEISVAIRAKHSIDYGVCKRQVKFPLQVSNETKKVYKLQILYNPKEKQCNCRPLFFNAMNYDVHNEG